MVAYQDRGSWAMTERHRETESLRLWHRVHVSDPKRPSSNSPGRASLSRSLANNANAEPVIAKMGMPRRVPWPFSINFACPWLSPLPISFPRVSSYECFAGYSVPSRALGVVVKSAVCISFPIRLAGPLSVLGGKFLPCPYSAAT
jgi:hypothetical protein